MKYLEHFQNFKHPNLDILKLNTSNKNKAREYQEFGLKIKGMSNIDVEEPLSDPETIIRYKASKVGENIIVEDTNLFIEDSDIGVDIKFKKDFLKDHIGKSASFDVYIGFLQNDKVYIYKGVTQGKIVSPTEGGWGFDAYFMPIGFDKTFAQSKPKETNPRYKCLQNMINNKIFTVLDPLYNWDGDFQS